MLIGYYNIVMLLFLLLHYGVTNKLIKKIIRLKPTRKITTSSLTVTYPFLIIYKRLQA